MVTPSTSWAERTQPGEAERHAQVAKRFVDMQQAKSVVYFVSQQTCGVA